MLTEFIWIAVRLKFLQANKTAHFGYDLYHLECDAGAMFSLLILRK